MDLVPAATPLAPVAALVPVDSEDLVPVAAPEGPVAPEVVQVGVPDLVDARVGSAGLHDVQSGVVVATRMISSHSI